MQCLCMLHVLQLAGISEIQHLERLGKALCLDRHLACVMLPVILLVLSTAPG